MNISGGGGDGVCALACVCACGTSTLQSLCSFQLCKQTNLISVLQLHQLIFQTVLVHFYIRHL